MSDNHRANCCLANGKTLRNLPPWINHDEWFHANSLMLTPPHAKCETLTLQCDTCGFVCSLPLWISQDQRTCQSMSEIYTPEYSPFSGLENNTSCLWVNAVSSISALLPDWQILHFKPLTADNCNQLVFELGKQFRSNSYVYTMNWQATTNTLESYWSARPSQLRNTYQRKKRALSKLAAKIEIHTDLTSELAIAYWHVYERSWKQQEKSQQFIDWLLRYSSDNQQLRFGVVYLNEKPIACQFWLVCNNKAYIFKLAQDKEFDYLSPGTVLMGDMMNYVISQDKVVIVDFLTGNDDYKKMWMDRASPLYGVEIFNLGNLRGRLRWYFNLLKKHVKRLVIVTKSRFLGAHNDH